MKKRMIALLLALSLGTALTGNALAADTVSGALQTVQALGILSADSSELDQTVTRAEFAQMLTQASTYQDTVSGEGSGYSLYKDVKSGHWASEYIKLAVEQGWMTGYTDGTFRPDAGITLEEACSAALALLGYDTSALAGSFPAAQLSKASSVGLRARISAGQGETLTLRDCVFLFDDLLTAKTAEGQVYAAALGYTVTDGEVDYSELVKENIQGPYVAGGSAPDLPFDASQGTVYRDGSEVKLADLEENDVYYYSEELKTVWSYSDQVTGEIEALSPDVLSPTAVTVNGTSYSITTNDASYALSALGGRAVGDLVTLLLGMDGSVAAVLTGSDVEAVYYGVVTSSGSGLDSDQTLVRKQLDVICSDGVSRTVYVSKDDSYPAGTVVSIHQTESGTTVEKASKKSAGGTVNSTATRLGSYTLSTSIDILDVAGSGSYTAVSASRLAGVTLDSSDVLYYALDQSGKISDLILNDVTGDAWTYGYLLSTDSTESAPMGDEAEAESVVTTLYTYLTDGKETQLSTTDSYSVRQGGVALRYNGDGSIQSFRTLKSAKLLSLGTKTATAGNQTYDLASDVQVYLRDGTNYYEVELEDVNVDDYTLTGWYDNFGCAAGGQIRVILAVEK